MVMSGFNLYVGDLDGDSRRARLDDLRNPNSPYFLQVLRMARDEMARKERMEKDAARERVRVDVILRPEEVAELKKVFSYTVESVASEFAGGSYADAFAACMFRKVLKAKSWNDEDILAYDMDLMSLVARGVLWAHVCRTSRNALTYARYQTEDRALERTCRSKNLTMRAAACTMMAQLRVGQGANVCTSARDCEHKADTVVFDVTRVQPSAAQVAACLIQHGAVRAKGWFFFLPEMLLGGSGDLKCAHARYVVGATVDYVTVFTSTGNTLYTYKVASMMSLAANQVFVFGDAQFSVELHDGKDGVVEWTMTRVEKMEGVFSPTVTRLWRLPRSTTDVEQWVRQPESEGGGMVRSRVTVDTELLDKVCARLVSSNEKRITLDHSRQAVSDIVSNAIVAGAYVTRLETMRADTCELLARATWKYALLERAKAMAEVKVLARNLNAAYDGGLLDAAKLVVAAFVETGISLADAAKDLATKPWTVLSEGVDHTVTMKLSPEYEMVTRRFGPGGENHGALGACDSYMPHADGMVSGVSSATDDEAREIFARASVGMTEDAEAAEDVFFDASEGAYGTEEVVETDVNKRDSGVVLGADRENLVSRMEFAYQTHDNVYDALFSQQLHSGVVEPKCTEVPVVGNPYGVMQEDFDYCLPGVSSVDYDMRAHLYSEASANYVYDAVKLRVNTSVDLIARAARMRRSVLRGDVSGPRPTTQAEIMSAFAKRVCSAPVGQGDIDMGVSLVKDFGEFATVCFRPGWRQVVESRVAQGMWQPHLEQLRRNVAKLAPGVVDKFESQEFAYSDMVVNEFLAMFKRQPKPKLDTSVIDMHAPGQTIMYGESKWTNTLFSSMLSEFHDVLDAVLKPEVLINVRRDNVYVERHQNALEARRKTAGSRLKRAEVDITQTDKSQTRYNLSLYFYVLEEFGICPELSKMWKIFIGRKKAVSVESGLMLEFFAQVVSGLFATISMNSLITAIATVRAFKLVSADLVSLRVQGDDVTVEFVGDANVLDVTERYARGFNFEAKVFFPKWLYWCGMYIIQFEGYWFFIRDPMRIYSALARAVPESYDVDAAYESFFDMTKHYEKEQLVELLATAVAERNGYGYVPLGLCRAINTIRNDKKLFASRLGPVEVITVK